MRFKIVIGLLFLLGQFSCSDNQTSPDLNGTWVDTESSGFSFIEFNAGNQGRFGIFAKNYEQYDDFIYRRFDDKIAIDFIGDDQGETVHDLIFVEKDRIRISGLTAIPENPLKTYQRYEVVGKDKKNEIVLGPKDIYFDFENGFSLRGYCNGESRCPEGATCVWAGYASARFNLIMGGNDEHTFDLSTIDLPPSLKRDTLIDGITFTLLDIIPYPVLDAEHDPEDYKVILSVEGTN